MVEVQVHRESLWPARPVSLEGFFWRVLVERGTHSAGMAYYHGARMPFPSEVPQALHYRWLAERGGLVTHQKVRNISDWSLVKGISLLVMGRVEWLNQV